jgi:Zn-dependent protease
MWVSLAGPFSNLLLAILAAIPFRAGLVSIYDALPARQAILPTPAEFLFEFISINLLLMLFNLIPLSPLDGEKVAESLLPPNLARTWDMIRPYSPILLLVIVFVLPMLGFDILGWIIYPPMRALLTLLVG